MDDEHIERGKSLDSLSLEAAQEINELRGKLARRNSLLNEIRKAYHRDVLAIKECLIDAQSRGVVVHENLQSVPSIDLRDTFRLFAPQECELRIRPCWSCGGQFEIIHRESSRIVEFKHSIQILWEREKELCEELIGVKEKAQEDRLQLENVNDRHHEEREALLEQISLLNQQVTDRNALDDEVRHLKEEVKNLEAILKSQEPVLLDRDRLLIEIERMSSSAHQENMKFNEKVEHTKQLQHSNNLQACQLLVIGQENEELKRKLLELSEKCNKANEECSLLAREISRREVEKYDINARFKSAETTMGELQSKFEQDELRIRRSIDYLESKCSALETTVSELCDKFRATSAGAEFYRMGIATALEDAKRRGLITCVPRQSSMALAKVGELILETDRLRHRSDVLFNLLLGCIRSMYEGCLLQERILRDHGSELHKSDQKLKFTEQANDKARMILDHLTNADDSNTIEWVSILSDETDRRHIMGHLQNRLQLGQFSLDKAFQTTCETHAREMCTRRHQLDLEMKKRCDIARTLTDAVTVNRKYEEKIIKVHEMKVDIQSMVDCLRVGLHQIRNDCLRNNEVTATLNDDYKQIQTLAYRLVDELHSSKKELSAQKVHLVEKEADLSVRDAVIENMEAQLEKIAHRYAEKERLRIKVHANIGVQVTPAVADAAVHADFLPVAMRRVNQILSDDALVPGRIINVPDKNWPSRINIGPMQSALQYRRTLDKL